MGTCEYCGTEERYGVCTCREEERERAEQIRKKAKEAAESRRAEALSSISTKDLVAELLSRKGNKSIGMVVDNEQYTIDADMHTAGPALLVCLDLPIELIKQYIPPMLKWVSP